MILKKYLKNGFLMSLQVFGNKQRIIKQMFYDSIATNKNASFNFKSINSLDFINNSFKIV